MAATADGGFVVTLTDDAADGSSTSVQAQRFDSSGVEVGSQFQVNTSTANWQDESTVAGLTGGGFVVAWRGWNQDGRILHIPARLTGMKPVFPIRKNLSQHLMIRGSG